LRFSWRTGGTDIRYAKIASESARVTWVYAANGMAG
jgi:hypothetical protein